MLATCYLIHGGDIPQTNKIIANLKQQAKQQDFNDFIVFDITPKAIWEPLLQKCQNLDMFSGKTFIELRISSDTIDKANGTALLNFLQLPDPQTRCVVITAPKLKPAVLNSTWVKFIQQHGKLQTTKSLPPIFQLSNAAMAGDLVSTINIFNSLKNSGTDPILILWNITREIRQLLHVKYKQQTLKHYQQLALQRLATKHLESLLQFASSIDHMLKGITAFSPWEPLLALYLSFTNPALNPLPMEDITICNKA